MAEFANNNANNFDIGYIVFELNCKYNLWFFIRKTLIFT